MCNIIWLKVMLDASDVVRLCGVYGIYEIINAVSVYLSGISHDIQNQDDMN